MPIHLYGAHSASINSEDEGDEEEDLSDEDLLKQFLKEKVKEDESSKLKLVELFEAHFGNGRHVGPKVVHSLLGCLCGIGDGVCDRIAGLLFVDLHRQHLFGVVTKAAGVLHMDVFDHAFLKLRVKIDEKR